MKIINKIIIKYFRSIYTASVSECLELNVISGRNDCGKSNTLRALNLFFNGQTDWERTISFYEDFSIQRLDSVRKESVKGRQFISIEIEFSRPTSYAASLPATFSVTRTWHRESTQYEERNNLESTILKNKLPSKINTAKRALQKFLNRIQYEYVPAIKDRPYILNLIARLQKNMLAIEGQNVVNLNEIVSRMSEIMKTQVSELNAEFKNATGLSTSFKEPAELSSLFQAFNVVTDSNTDQAILLRARGDGIQARYLSSVLHTLASQSNHFFIWGFEEPENSLEMGVCEKLAIEFSNVYAKKSQIFVTTHSPAFIALNHPHVARFRAFQEDDRTQLINLRDSGRGSQHMSSLEQELGMLKIQERVHEMYAGQIAEFHALQKLKESIQLELEQSLLPLVLVEGKSDKKIIDIAWSKLSNEIMPFRVRVADPAGNDGTAGAGMLAKTIESVHLDDGRKCIAVFDQDSEGIKCFKSLSKNFKIDNGISNNVKKHVNNLSYVMLLPAPPYRSKYAEVENHMIEYMFEDEVLGRKKNNKGLVFIMEPLIVTCRGKVVDVVNVPKWDLNEFENLEYRKITSGKDVFSEEIVPGLERECFNGFIQFFSSIKKIIQN